MEDLRLIKDISLKYRGSSNQRVIDVKKSIEQDTLIELNILD